MVELCRLKKKKASMLFTGELTPILYLSSCLFQNNAVNLAADFSAIKELDSLSNEIVELQR